MPNQRPFVEFSCLLDFAERYRRVDPAAEAEIGDGELRVLRVGPAAAHDIGNAHNRGFAHAVIDKDPVARLHFADGTDRLRVPNAVPDRLPFALKLLDGVRFRVGFGEKIVLGVQKYPPPY